MASTTPMRHRVFAGLGAALFLVTGSALTISVIWDAISNKNTTSSSTTSTDTTSSCTISSVDGKAALTAPEVYKTSEKTTTLVKTDIETGTGAEAKSGDCLVVKYYGTLASSGTLFDENFTKTTALEFKVGEGQVITGWDQGVPGMKVGGVRRLVIPSSMGYGSTAQSSIPANSDLVFVVKLLEIK